jgi:sugar/nucleoside kinase (ribokinase family)
VVARRLLGPETRVQECYVFVAELDEVREGGEAFEAIPGSVSVSDEGGSDVGVEAHAFAFTQGRDEFLDRAGAGSEEDRDRADVQVPLGPIVAVAKGANGSVLTEGSETVEINPVTAPVSDTVGAGDSYISALLWAMLGPGRTRVRPITGRELAQAAGFAAKAAAITVSRSGTEPPTLREVEGR